MEFPKDLRYTKEHEWAKASGNKVVVGITAFAVEQLGDITLVDLPKVGDTLQQGDTFGTIESVKSVSDLFAPLSGKVTKINEALEDKPELVNDSPYEAGWMVEIEIADPKSLNSLLSSDAYSKLVKSA